MKTPPLILCLAPSPPPSVASVWPAAPHTVLYPAAGLELSSRLSCKGGVALRGGGRPRFSPQGGRRAGLGGDSPPAPRQHHGGGGVRRGLGGGGEGARPGPPDALLSRRRRRHSCPEETWQSGMMRSSLRDGPRGGGAGEGASEGAGRAPSWGFPARPASPPPSHAPPGSPYVGKGRGDRRDAARLAARGQRASSDWTMPGD